MHSSIDPSISVRPSLHHCSCLLSVSGVAVSRDGCGEPQVAILPFLGEGLIIMSFCDILLKSHLTLLFLGADFSSGNDTLTCYQ